jgi:hypothetical protein
LEVNKLDEAKAQELEKYDGMMISEVQWAPQVSISNKFSLGSVKLLRKLIRSRW